MKIVSLSMPKSSDVTHVTLRPALPEDADAIAALRVEGWQNGYRGLVPDSYLDSMRAADSAKVWRQVLQAASDAAAIVVAERRGEVVGFAAGMTLAEEKVGFDAELSALFVTPSAQRQGTGGALLRAVAAHLKHAGATGMISWMLAENHAARAFHLKLGGVLQIEQPYMWDDLALVEVGIGWSDIDALL